jgi:DNA-binding NarL/FixJ family response regulator
MSSLANVAPKIRVMCVDDCADIPAMLARCIAREPDMESVGSMDTADGLTEHVGRMHPDVVLLDMSIPGSDPLDALRKIAAIPHSPNPAATYEGTRVIAYSGHFDREAVASAMDAGARGYISKDADIPHVLDAIRAVARGDVVVVARRR